jgi:very-short-patch-repair endonuclease
VDFYSTVLSLAIELDGSGHMKAEQRRIDQEHSQLLAAAGVRVIRFWNTDILRHTNVVLEQIVKAARLSG